MTAPVGSVRVGIDADASDFERALQDAVADAMRDVQRELAANALRVHFDVGDIRFEVERGIAEAQRYANTHRIQIDLDINSTGAVTEMRTARAQLQAAATPITQQVNVEVDRDSLGGGRSSLAGLDGSLHNLVGAAGGLSAVAAGIVAIGGAAGLAAGAVGGLVTAAIALGPAFGAVVGTATVALQGVGDAFKALQEATQASPQEAEAQAEAIASATNQVASAERGLRDAKRDARDAEEDLTQARKDATEQLEDYHRQARGGVLDEREAIRDIRKVRRELAKVSPLDADAYQEAIDRVARAELRLDEVRDRNADNAAKLADAERKGIEGSDQVVAARDRITQANERVAAAEDQLTRAQQALTKAQTEGTPSAQKLQEALANLSPNAQAFVLAAQELAPAWEEVRKSVQDTAFAGAADGLTHLSNAVLPTLREGMNAVAGEMNLGAHGFAEFLSSAEGISGLQAVFANTANLLRGMREGSDGFLAGLSQLSVAAAPFMEGLGRALGGIGTALGDAFSQLADSGVFGDVLAGLTTALEGVGPLLRDLLLSFATMAKEVLPSLKPLFESLGQTLVAIAPSLGQLGAVFADSLTAILPTLGTLISELATGLRPVLPVIANLLTSLGEALRPLIGPLSQTAVVVGTALATAIQALTPAIGPLAQAFADIVTAVAPLIPLFAENLSVILQALAPAISQIAVALAPVIAMFAQQMRPVIEQIAPILADVAMTIGRALADAIRQIAPVLPQIVTSFSNLLLAILPLLPELVRLAAELLPPLLDIFVQLSPVLLRAIDAFTWLVQNVIIPLVLPAIQQMVDNWRTGLQTISDVIHWVTDEVFPALRDGIDQVKGWFDSGVSAITTAWDKLKEAAAVPVRFVVQRVWNDGLLKAWNTAARFLPGIEPMEPVTLGFRRGGSVHGPGTGTSDSIPAWLSAGEHVVTAMEVLRAGGQNVLYAIRDMIARGIPFTWDGGRVISLLGRDNLSAYGAQVRQRGIGNVPPEGLFDPLLPRFRTGGAVVLEPWMQQLLRGHEFARAQNGKPYQWAGPRYVGDSFDCSGYMASIAAAILGQNPWQRYWATSSFGRAQRATGPQGFVAGVGPGFSIGVTDDPGGPGGGHTAGVLGPVPGVIAQAMRVESGGARGDVHYGDGPDPRSFLTQYHLPIGANGFFQPGTGSGVGPSPDHQRSFVEQRIADIFAQVFNPIRDAIGAAVGAPPPEWRRIPPAALTTVERKAVDFLAGMVGGLGDLLPSAWQGAQQVFEGIGDTAGRVFDALNPFRRQRGGPIPGTGIGDIMPALLEPGEIVMNRRAAAAFGPLLLGLNRAVPRFQTGGTVGGLLGGIAAGAIPVQVVNFGDLTAAGALPAAVQTGMESAVPALSDATLGAVSQAGQQVAGDIGAAVTEAITNPPPGTDTVFDPTQPPTPPAADQETQLKLDEQGRLLSETRDIIARTSSSEQLVWQQSMQQLREEVMRVVRLLGADVLTPTVQSAMDAAIGVVQGWLGAGFSDVRTGTDRTTAAVENLDPNAVGAAAPPPFGAPGSAFDAAQAISDAVVSVADSATQAFQQVAQEVARAALQQRPSRVDNSRGVLGRDIDGGTLINTLVNLTGVEIEIHDTLIDTLDEVKAFRQDLFGTFEEQGRLMSDTAALMQRNESSRDLVLQEQNRLNRELLKAVLRYLMTAVVIPIMTAILGAMIQLAVTAIGAAIGSVIPGIGTAIGAAIGAVVGAALAGAAAIFTSTLAVGAAAAIDSFDTGGVAHGKGLMVKDTNLPERVLNPTETSSYDRLGRIADHLESTTNRTSIHAPIHVHGGDARTADRVHNRLISLLPR